MRWCIAMVIAIAVALLLACPVSADPITGPIALAGMGDVGINPSTLALGRADLVLDPSRGVKFALPRKLGVIAVDQAGRLEPSNSGNETVAPSGHAQVEEIADAITNRLPAIAEPWLQAESSYGVNLATVDLEAGNGDPANDLAITTVAAPEPSTLLLLGTGLLGLALTLFRRARTASMVRK